jgi:diguanylate cyclase (GGDEF)-like protein
MKTNDQIVLPTSQSDVTLLKRLSIVQFICLGIAGLIAVAILLAWLITSTRASFPEGWYVMKFNTALGMLLSTVSLVLLSVTQTSIRLWGSRALGAVVLLLAAVAVYEHASGHLTGLDTLIVSDATSNTPGLMSVQTSAFFLLMGACLLLCSARVNRWGAGITVLITLLAVHVLIIFSGYCFTAVQLIGQSMITRTSPHTLTCMLLLTIGLMCWWAQNGHFSLLVGQGIGSQLARRVLPFALLLPFVLMLSSAGMARAGWMSPPVAVGLAVAVMAAAFGGLVSLMGRRINTLEREIRAQSLTDEFTGVFNNRGFNLLGEQSLREAQRGNATLTLLVFDLDNVKEIGEKLGHEVASRFVQDVAGLLRSNFGPADIVARTESDEFAVITKDENTGGVIALMRIGEAVDAMNGAKERPYVVSFSVGEAVSAPGAGESFTQLVTRANLMMRERKRIQHVFGREAADSAPVASVARASDNVRSS